MKKTDIHLLYFLATQQKEEALPTTDEQEDSIDTLFTQTGE
jgi:hypothetical protein